MTYPDNLTITRHSSETTSSMGGVTTSGSTTLYDDKADVQDKEVVFRLDDGTIRKEGDAMAFLPEEADVTSLKVGDQASITYATGVTKSGVVAKVHLLDYKVMIRYS